jgi:hypothetical protein
MIASLHSRSLRFAKREVEICRYTVQAAMINLHDSKTAHQVHEAQCLAIEAVRRFHGALGKRAFEIRQL